MRILMITGTFAPRGFGGITMISYKLARELVKRGHKVTVYTTDVGNNCYSRLNVPSRKTIEEIEVHYFKNISNLIAFKYRLYLPIGILSIIKKDIIKFDIIHLHEFRSILSIIVHHFAEKYGIPYVFQAHGSLPRIEKKGLKWIYDTLLGSKVLRDASKVIALSKFEAEQYRHVGIPEEKIAIIPNGIDLSEYANLPPKGQFKKKFNIPEDKKIVLYLGRIHKTKGIDLLVKAYAHLTNKMNSKGTILVIAGPNDGYLGEAKLIVKTLGISDSVLFTEFISSGDKLGALIDADVFVTPSFYGFPMTFLEACAVGTPIIATSLGDTLEWIDGRVGYLTEPTHQALAEAIYRIVSDDELRRKFSRNCIDVVRTSFSLEKVVEKLEKVYQEVAERKCAP